VTLPEAAVVLIEAGDMTLEAVAELATVSTQGDLQEVADIAFSVAAELTDGWTAGLDEPDPAVVAARLREAAWRYTVAAALHEALAHRAST